MLCQRRSTAPGWQEAERFRITHPHHPLKDREFELLGFGHTWGEDRVFFQMAGEQQTRSVPTIWTDLAEPDRFVVLAAGRSDFRINDLLRLAALVAEIAEERCK